MVERSRDDHALTPHARRLMSNQFRFDFARRVRIRRRDAKALTQRLVLFQDLAVDLGRTHNHGERSWNGGVRRVEHPLGADYVHPRELTGVLPGIADVGQCRKMVRDLRAELVKDFAHAGRAR